MKDEKMLEYARDLRSDLKYAFEQGEGQTPNHKDVQVMDWLINQVKILQRTDDKSKQYEKALREIDTHIRSSKNPIPYIVETLKVNLSDYEV